MLEIIKFESLKKGKNILILGAIHGNEICGPNAILNIINRIKSSEIKLEGGSITFIPVCNVEAFKQNKRFIDINLNRSFKKIENPLNYEEEISQTIIKYIDECDYLLDIHSIPTDGPSFAFLDKNDKNIREFVEIQNFKYMMMGWNELFGEDDNSTCGYGFRQNKICVTIECGNHNNPDCINVAETAILNSLSFLKITDNKITKNKQDQKCINMEKVFYKNKDGSFIKDWKHLDKISSGEIIAKYNDGEVLKAEKDCLIIMPHDKDIKLGAEWFYIGNFI